MGEHEEPPENVDWKPYHTRAWECGWCDDWVTGITPWDVHLRLLWHQWWNHRERIWEEY